MRRFFCDNWLYIKTAHYVYLYAHISYYALVTITLCNALLTNSFQMNI